MAVARLASQHSPEPATEDEVRRDWLAPGFELEHDARLDDAAYVAVDAFGDGRVWIDVHGHPSSEMIEWGEARARQKGSRLLSGGWTSNEALLAELDQHGFQPIRHSHRIGSTSPARPPRRSGRKESESATFGRATSEASMRRTRRHSGIRGSRSRSPTTSGHTGRWNRPFSSPIFGSWRSQPTNRRVWRSATRAPELPSWAECRS